MAPLQNPSGFWEPKTSTLDWCENNYEVKYKYIFQNVVLLDIVNVNK